MLAVVPAASRTRLLWLHPVPDLWVRRAKCFLVMAKDRTEDDAVARNAAQFATTHWSVVLAAGDSASPDSQEALEKLCRTYWYPLYAYVRRRGFSPEDAEDLTQDFFASFLEKGYLERADRDKGRFRTFMLTSLLCAAVEKCGGGRSKSAALGV